MKGKRPLIISLLLIFMVTAQTQTVPLDKRNVAGILRDSLNKPIGSATVSL